MPRAEKGTPKYLANRMKSKGLQKLRWYCQMCEKQCRDENGFKCHTMSESHQRQMVLFSENSHTYIDKFSKEFLSEFMKVLSRRFGTRRVKANTVYQEYISFKEHLHMNATRWTTLTEFCNYLGEEGMARVEHAEQGVYIQYIDRSPRALERMRELEKKERMNYYDEEITQKLIQAQIELANSKMTSNLDALGPAKNEFKRSSDDPKILLKVNLKSTTSVVQSNALQSIKPAHESSKPAETSKLLKKAPKDPLEELRETEIKKRLRVTRENWLFPDIVVKVMHAELENGKYYKHKGVVLKVHEKFIGEVRMLDSGDLLRLDQDDLETVIPRIGGKVLIVNTAFAGATGALVAINSETFTALIRIDKGINKDTEIWLPYEHFSKLTVQ